MTGTWIINFERLWRREPKKRSSRFWGQDYAITPARVSTVLGDGCQIIGFESFDTRPDYYILRVDSRWSENNCSADPICDHVHEIIEAIENDFGRHREEWDHANGRAYVKHWPFPAYHDGTGCSAWWTIFNLIPQNAK